MLLGGLSTVVTIFVLHVHHNPNIQGGVGRTTRVICRFLANVMCMSLVITETRDDLSWEHGRLKENKNSKHILYNFKFPLNDTKLLENQMESNQSENQYVKTLMQLQADMAYMRVKSDTKEHKYRIHNEWKAIALIIDRFSFWVSFALILAVSFIITFSLNS